jgi:hypothetical protein
VTEVFLNRFSDMFISVFKEIKYLSVCQFVVVQAASIWRPNNLIAGHVGLKGTFVSSRIAPAVLTLEREALSEGVIIYSPLDSLE